MKTTIAGVIVSAFISIVLVVTAVQAEIKVGIAGDLSGSALTAGEQQEIGALKAIDHLIEKAV